MKIIGWPDASSSPPVRGWRSVVSGIVPFPRVTVTQQQVFHFPRRDQSIEWPVFVHRHALFVYGLPGGRDGGEHNAQKVAEFDNGTVTTATVVMASSTRPPGRGWSTT